MKLNVVKEYAALEAMSVKELLAEWPRYFEEPPKTRSNKSYLLAELIYRIQELTYGGLTKQTIERLEALAANKKINRNLVMPSSRLAIGTRLVREVKGVEHHVTVLEEGFEYQGIKYKSLSGVAYAITGTRWNGNAFFGLNSSAKPKRPKFKYKRGYTKP